MQNSILNHSDILSANRLDAEYFQPKFLEPFKKIQEGKYKKLHELCEFVRVGPAGSALPASVYTSSGIKIIRPSNLNGWNCNDEDPVFISGEYGKKNNLNIYQNGDILIGRIGDIKFGIVSEKGNAPVTISPNIIAVRSGKELLDPYFLLAFFHTKFGLPQIRRGEKIAALSSLGIKQVANVLVPALPLKEQIKIGNAVKRGLKKIQLAKILYVQAEKILAQTIGLDKTEENRSSMVINHEKLRNARRADAEYFLAQKYTIREPIKTIQIDEIAEIFRGIEPGSKAYQKSGKLFLRVSNISKYGLLDKSQKYVNNGLYEKLQKKYQPRAGEILLVKDGKPGVAFALAEPIEGLISEGIVRLQIKCHAEFIPIGSGRDQNDTKTISPEYISLCINSPICRSQIQSHTDGSLVPHWKIEQIKKLRIPVSSLKVRKTTASYIKKSAKFFRESKNDFDLATKQAEMLIDNSL